MKKLQVILHVGVGSWIVSAAITVMFGLAASSSIAAEKTLVISSWGSPKHVVNSIVWPTWG